MKRLLDLFCGAGGASLGYSEAGFDVTGVDNRFQPAYPFAFIEMDAFEALRGVEGYDVIHASPPCQGYSPAVSSASSAYAGTLGKDEPRLIAPLRDVLRDIGSRYVIENVVGARDEMHPNLLLCGTMFGLPIARHRLFETSIPIPQPWHPPCNGVAKRYADKKGWDRRDMTVTGKGRHAGTKERWAEVMGWPGYAGTQHGLREAIPPAYTLYIGSFL